MYARLYDNLLMRYRLSETEADWQILRGSLKELVDRYPTPYYKNRAASLACVAKDTAAFTEALATLPATPVHKGDWIKGHGYDACIRWAGT